MTTDNSHLEALLDAQQIVIEKIALDEPISDTLECICLQIERVLDDTSAKSSILTLTGNTLHHGAAPHLPLPFTELVEGLEIGPKAGSCGTAAYDNRQVIVTDIANDPLWEDVAQLVEPFELKACWSTPIHSSKNEVLGTFAIYYTSIKAPEDFHLNVIRRFGSLAGMALERHRAKMREKVLNKHLAVSMERLQAFTQVMPDLALILSESGEYVDIYGASDDLLYDKRENVIGKTVNEVLPAERAKAIMGIIQETLKQDQSQIFEYQLKVPKGLVDFEGRTSVIQRYSASDPERQHVLLMARDITQRKEAEREIKQLAFYDPLTELPNRRLLVDRLQRVLAHIKRKQTRGALIFIDLDNFKVVNDSQGHSVGDELLIQVADRLRQTLRNADTIARMGGDEFIVILENAKVDHHGMEQEAKTVAQRILDCLVPAFVIQNKSIHINGSLGVAMIDAGMSSPDDVMGMADSAMYRAKRAGRGQACFSMRGRS